MSEIPIFIVDEKLNGKRDGKKFVSLSFVCSVCKRRHSHGSEYKEDGDYGHRDSHCHMWRNPRSGKIHRSPGGWDWTKEQPYPDGYYLKAEREGY
jgi:hypothetical protein